MKDPIPINWMALWDDWEDLFDIISPIEYLPSRETWEESKEIQLYIRAWCPIHGHHLFISWDKIKNDRDVQNDPAVDKLVRATHTRSPHAGGSYLGAGNDYVGYRFINPLNPLTPFTRINLGESLFICTQCRKDSGHALSFLELFG